MEPHIQDEITKIEFKRNDADSKLVWQPEAKKNWVSFPENENRELVKALEKDPYGNKFELGNYNYDLQFKIQRKKNEPFKKRQIKFAIYLSGQKKIDKPKIYYSLIKTEFNSNHNYEITLNYMNSKNEKKTYKVNYERKLSITIASSNKLDFKREFSSDWGEFTKEKNTDFGNDIIEFLIEKTLQKEYANKINEVILVSQIRYNYLYLGLCVAFRCKIKQVEIIKPQNEINCFFFKSENVFEISQFPLKSFVLLRCYILLQQSNQINQNETDKISVKIKNSSLLDYEIFNYKGYYVIPHESIIYCSEVTANSVTLEVQIRSDFTFDYVLSKSNEQVIIFQNLKLNLNNVNLVVSDKLRVLKLVACKIEKKELLTMMPYLLACQSLKTFDISDNNISESGFCYLIENLEKLSIIDLVVSNNKIGKISDFREEFFSNLEILDISDNLITDSELRLMFCGICSLQFLDIRKSKNITEDFKVLLLEILIRYNIKLKILI